MEQLRLPLTNDYYIPEPKYKIGEILKAKSNGDRIIVMGAVYHPRAKQFSYMVNNCDKIYQGYHEVPEDTLDRYKRE